ncbi:MAG: trifunctional transcriptional regulator/proline dehydrogenase/L-glutamate gamma-semialdehyde dehydrogenase, partial [Janthinobacterium lividum]
MATTTLGVKLDDASRERLKRVAQSIDRTPHWLIKQAIFTYLDQVERGQLPTDANGTAADGLPSAAAAVSDVHEGMGDDTAPAVQPFLEFAQSVQPQSVLRAAITAAYRRPETEAIPMLLEQARLPGALASEAKQLARNLAGKLRAQKAGTGREGLVQGLIQEFSLSSQEGVALMCLAEALLRIPDK